MSDFERLVEAAENAADYDTEGYGCETTDRVGNWHEVVATVLRETRHSFTASEVGALDALLAEYEQWKAAQPKPPTREELEESYREFMQKLYQAAAYDR